VFIIYLTIKNLNNYTECTKQKAVLAKIKKFITIMKQSSAMINSNKQTLSGSVKTTTINPNSEAIKFIRVNIRHQKLT